MNRYLLLATILVGCGKSGAEGDTTTTGSAAYRDASTNSDGSSRPPAKPPRQDGMTVTIETSGTGTLDGLDATCLDGATGGFDALYEGEGEIDDDGVYVSSLALADVTTPSGCAADTLDITSLTSLVVRAELQNTSENCESYCTASAAADAEEQCEGDLDEASCRADAEAELMADCETECSESTTVIVAESSVNASLLGSLGLDGGDAIGEVGVDLTFDHMEH